LNPVRRRLRDDPAGLKKRYRGRMAFWGGTDSQNIVPRGSVADVKRMVEKLIEDLGEGGGYIFSNCHNIQPDVPLAERSKRCSSTRGSMCRRGRGDLRGLRATRRF